MYLYEFDKIIVIFGNLFSILLFLKFIRYIKVSNKEKIMCFVIKHTKKMVNANVIYIFHFTFTLMVINENDMSNSRKI